MARLSEHTRNRLHHRSSQVVVFGRGGLRAVETGSGRSPGQQLPRLVSHLG